MVKSAPWEGRLKLLRTAKSKDGYVPLPSLVKTEAKLPGLELGLLCLPNWKPVPQLFTFYSEDALGVAAVLKG